MQAFHVSLAFCAALVLSLGVKFWLAGRQARHVHRHREQVPAAFQSTIPLPAHQRAADYTQARLRLGLVSEAVGTVLLLGWTLLGGLDALNTLLREALLPVAGPMGYQLGLVAVFGLIGTVLDLPLEWYRTFRVEQRFGFNRSSLALFAGDQLKGLAVGALLGLPLVAAVLWVMRSAGEFWWLWAWALWTGFMLLMQVLYPTLIAPLFNRFTPLADAALAERVHALMQRCGFQARGLFVMDGSRRSAHGNAYFAGMGRAKRVVFFDTLLERLSPVEVEAVLAHELGHFHHRHVRHRLLLVMALSAGGLALLATLANYAPFYLGLGVRPNLGAPNDALALLLFMMAVPPVLFFVSPLMAQLSRRDEFQADAYARAQSSAEALSSALLKLYEDNASTLTPDPVYARFYYSHPPASERLAALARP